MDDEIKEKLGNTDVWSRGLYMLLFILILGLTKFVVGVVVLFQFLTNLFTGSCNDRLTDFGQRLAQYLSQTVLFLCYSTEEKPFPFSDWPTSENETARASSGKTTNRTSAEKTRKKTTRKKSNKTKTTSPDQQAAEKNEGDEPAIHP